MQSNLQVGPTCAALGFLTAVLLMVVTTSSFCACGNGTRTESTYLESTAAPGNVESVRVSHVGKCSIAGRITGATSPVFLTALGYHRISDDWVVSQFANIEIGRARSFEILGLTPGMWLVSARALTGKSSAWGRSEPIWVSSDAPLKEAAIELEVYGVRAQVIGIPKELMGYVELSLDCVQADRVQVEGDEFLDAPIHSGAHSDAFQVFHSLQTIELAWIEGFHVPVAAPPGPTEALPFDVARDPFGLTKSRLSWISPCPMGNVALPLEGPSTVSVQLHGVPGLWEPQVITLEVERGRPNATFEFAVQTKGGEVSELPCRTAKAQTGKR